MKIQILLIFFLGCSYVICNEQMYLVYLSALGVNPKSCKNDLDNRFFDTLDYIDEKYNNKGIILNKIFKCGDNLKCVEKIPELNITICGGEHCGKRVARHLTYIGLCNEFHKIYDKSNQSWNCPKEYKYCVCSKWECSPHRIESGPYCTKDNKKQYEECINKVKLLGGSSSCRKCDDCPSRSCY